ncbi:MAG: hypothetical protein FWE20_02875 [Defluviitaleaceae bacterium]|nr:hypothetical protein [Defluviitaleaceae bacterium]
MSTYRHYVILFGSALIAFSAIYLYSGFYPLAVNHFNSYSIQAEAWLNGRLDVYNYRHLEIAVFDGRYFISFPPFPSFLMLPLVLIFGRTTPDHVIALATALLATFYAYKLAELHLKDKNHALFLSLFLILGTNYLHIALWGAVWYLAQNLSFLFTLMSIYYATTPSRRHSNTSLLLLCMAMGCRPLQGIFMPIIFYLIYEREQAPDIKTFIARLLMYSIPALVLGVSFLGLNFARFGNIFQLGHDFLPEFTDFGHDKFSLAHLPDNLRTIFRGLPQLHGRVISFPEFGGHAFWIASPIVVSYTIYFFAGLRSNTNIGEKIMQYAIPVFILLHIFALSLHRTLGGHQFGSRYTVDLLPIVFLGLILAFKTIQSDRLYCNIPLMAVGFITNLIGTIAFMNFYF